MHYAMRPRINSKDRFLREIAFLKKLKPSYMWRGELVHAIIAEVLSKSRFRKITLAQASKALDSSGKRYWDDSLERAESKNPKSKLGSDAPIIMEHYYKDLDDKLDILDILDLARHQLTNFFQWAEEKSLFELLDRSSRNWIDPPVYIPSSPGFMVDDVKFITKVDLALESSNFSIFDWKTSKNPKGAFHKSSEYRQTSFYALWPHLEMSHELENIDIRIIYIGGSKPNEYSFTISPHDVDALLADAELLVRASAELLKPDNDFTLEDFDWATSARYCQWCPFQQICQRELS